MSEQPILAWHFLPDDGMTRYEPRTKVVVGEWLSVDPHRLELCAYGLHASERLLDALQYAPGALLCRVEVAGRVLRADDKLCAERRRVIAWTDATHMLHEFACRCAESVLHLAGSQRHVARNAIDAKRRWLAGQANDNELAAAMAAAWAAAMAAAWGAARGAARDAAWGAARAAMAAASDAARDAAWAAQAAASDAAWAAARAAWGAARDASDATRDAAWDAQAAARDAAWAAARAAMDAARAAQDRMLTEMAAQLLKSSESLS
jgi:hypothetical protein